MRLEYYLHILKLKYMKQVSNLIYFIYCNAHDFLCSLFKKVVFWKIPIKTRAIYSISTFFRGTSSPKNIAHEPLLPWSLISLVLNQQFQSKVEKIFNKNRVLIQVSKFYAHGISRTAKKIKSTNVV